MVTRSDLPLHNLLDGVCSPAAVVPRDDLEALWKLYGSYRIPQLSMYFQGRIPEGQIVHTLSKSSYVQCTKSSLNASMDTFQSIFR